eukprot:scaffold9848_cov90-Isochrysis_galbana.AAC.1
MRAPIFTLHVALTLARLPPPGGSETDAVISSVIAGHEYTPESCGFLPLIDSARIVGPNGLTLTAPSLNAGPSPSH